MSRHRGFLKQDIETRGTLYACEHHPEALTKGASVVPDDGECLLSELKQGGQRENEGRTPVQLCLQPPVKPDLD